MCSGYFGIDRSEESRSRSSGIERIRTNDIQEREKLPAWGLPFSVELADHRYRLNENLITLVMPVQRGSETRKLYNWYRQPSIVTSKEIPFFLDVSPLVETMIYIRSFSLMYLFISFFLLFLLPLADSLFIVSYRNSGSRYAILWNVAREILKFYWHCHDHDLYL